MEHVLAPSLKMAVGLGLRDGEVGWRQDVVLGASQTLRLAVWTGCCLYKGC